MVISRMLRCLHTAITCFVLTLSASIFAFESKIKEKSPEKSLKKNIESVIFHADPTAQVGIKIISLKDGNTLFEKNSNEKFIPGGSLKIITAAAALQLLGPNFCFETNLYTNGFVDKGVLKGDLFLQGSGDPSLTGNNLDNLIFELKLLNVKEIEGDLVFDATEFDDLPLAPGWMWDEKLLYRDAPVDALIINHSCVNVWVKPSQLITMAPLVRIQPEIPGIVIENNASMGNINRKKNTIQVSTKNIIQKDVIHIEGLMSLKSKTILYRIPVKNPQLYAATEFSERLKSNGIKHFGKIRFEEMQKNIKYLATHRSNSMFDLTMHMLKNGDNLFANCFFKKVGRNKYGKPGTWPNGSQAIRDFLEELNEPLYAKAVILDGSGESAYNMITPNQMVSLLEWVDKEFIYAPELISSLSLSGLDPSLRKRFGSKHMKNKIRAQVGTLKGVSSICGYVTTRDSETLAFAIMINGFIKKPREIKEEIEDRVCDLLARFSRED